MDTAKIVNEDELAENLGTVLDRAHDGERFVIERDGEKLAVIVPLAQEASVGILGHDLIQRIGHLRSPGDGFADDIEAARENLLTVPVSPWQD